MNREEVWRGEFFVIERRIDIKREGEMKKILKNKSGGGGGG